MRMLVHTTAEHFKFWGCEVSGARGPGSIRHRARFVWGRIGIPQASAQITNKEFVSETEAINYAQGKVQEKQAKGYREFCFGPEDSCFEALMRAFNGRILVPGVPYDIVVAFDVSGGTVRIAKTNTSNQESIVSLAKSMLGETQEVRVRHKPDSEESKVIPGRPKRRIDL